MVEQTITFCTGFKDWNHQIISMCNSCARLREEECEDPDATFFARCPNDSFCECCKYIDNGQ